MYKAVKKPVAAGPDLDTADDAGLTKFFDKLEAVEGTVRLFERDRGEYYTAHGKDALFIARDGPSSSPTHR